MQKKGRGKTLLKFSRVYRNLRLDWFSKLPLIQIYLCIEAELSLLTECYPVRNSSEQIDN